MGFLDYFFSKKDKVALPPIQFGRFSDAYKPYEKYDAWDAAAVAFENEDFLDVYRNFFFYLTDESIENVVFSEQGDEISFYFYQGSKKIVGKANKERFQAEAKIAKTNGLHIGFLRKLLEENYNLKYCRYALDDAGVITIVFDSFAVDASPYKLYYGLKELSTKADKKDDVLIAEFEMLTPVNNGHIKYSNDRDLQAKFRYFKSELEVTLNWDLATKVNVNKYPGAQAYIYLDFIYRMDYLIKPEGVIMDAFDDVHTLYFNKNGITPEQKNAKIRSILSGLQEIDLDHFREEIYEVKSTFGLAQNPGKNNIKEYISFELKNVDWYYQNGYTAVAQAIPSYIIGYCFYAYSLQAPLRDFFNLYYQVTQPALFHGLGIELELVNGGILEEKNIKKQIKSIVKTHENLYPKLNPKTKLLEYQDATVFGKSLLMLCMMLDLTRIDNR